ncbi:uncharacterized protein C8Q71DRAFT_792005 [Rhodofomes roseus]|uniref:Impact N-terminal domain-containing protein n=1 Tax=Rhodofomes roseus TaxID=34475 RepID=A0ABQ8JYB3_9APHY|nr:uncharacterized protein C8Q71DRAFT_792005 [Rhodofomes roseus]KAH9829053.1 hypothetical protein C8Q71DRAFT_792005 [Rhodofomes roseus]
MSNGNLCRTSLRTRTTTRAQRSVSRRPHAIPLRCRHRSTHPQEPASSSDWPNPISSSSILVRSKSTFEAFASRHPDPHELSEPSADVSRFLIHLKATTSRARRATHAMWAWRSISATHGVRSCADDGGEAGAGKKLERLLELSACENVVLVVFRWYGGVQLGSQRWKCISQVAKEALEAGGFRGSPSAKDGAKRR